ncbi:nucleoplasmin-like isoform X1 [Gallus gallus]|uniref:nucleoplasmin-like isoform X1 n=1 Tax=Gallus gallus TaxID=9031 RepID=UPI001AE9383C|nr:nucleoplasmin-like isoform X1 [Gallus gallus]
MMLSQPKRHCSSCFQPLQKANPVNGSWLHAAALALDFGNLLQAFLSYFSSTCYYYRPAKGCFLWCLFHRSWFLVLCRMSSSSPALRSLSEDRTAAVLWGCELGVNSRSCVVKEDDDFLEHLVLLRTISLKGLEFVPPVTFMLQCGTGPVYLSGQHITLEDVPRCEAHEEELLDAGGGDENNARAAQDGD